MGHKNERWVFYKDVDPDCRTGGIERRVLAYCEGLMCVENAFETGAEGPMHSHPHTQITYVAEGVFSFTIDDETKTVRKGDTMLKTDGVIHGCKCFEAGVLVDFFMPMRDEFVSGD